MHHFVTEMYSTCIPDTGGPHFGPMNFAVWGTIDQINIELGNCLLPAGTKPLQVPILVNH